MFITVKMDKNYGMETVYPFCEQAKLFARIAGTKTLTRNTLRDVQLLGYKIVIAQENFKTFQNFINA